MADKYCNIITVIECGHTLYRRIGIINYFNQRVLLNFVSSKSTDMSWNPDPIRAHAAVIRLWQNDDFGRPDFTTPVWVSCFVKLLPTMVKILMPNVLDLEVVVEDDDSSRRRNESSRDFKLSQTTSMLRRTKRMPTTATGPVTHSTRYTGAATYRSTRRMPTIPPTRPVDLTGDFGSDSASRSWGSGDATAGRPFEVSPATRRFVTGKVRSYPWRNVTGWCVPLEALQRVDVRVDKSRTIPRGEDLSGSIEHSRGEIICRLNVEGDVDDNVSKR